jgi:hypothetical protein
MKLTSQSARVAFILQAIDMVRGPAAPLANFLEQAATTEVQKRPRFKPCVAEGKTFNSTIEAARYLSWHRKDLWVGSAAELRGDAHAVMENLRNRVKNWCNADDVVGYYWI